MENNKEFRKFSGASWGELNDIWPKDVRISNDYWKILSVERYAWRKIQQGLKEDMERYGVKRFRYEDFQNLCWIYRNEEAKDNVATEAFSVRDPLDWSLSIWVLKQSPLNRMGFIENMPFRKLRLYRVTGKGIQLIKDFVSEVEKAHRIAAYTPHRQPQENIEKVNVDIVPFIKANGVINEDTFNWSRREWRDK